MPAVQAFALATIFGLANADFGSKIGMGMEHAHNSTMHAAAGNFGTQLSREFTRYNDLPMGKAALQRKGWTQLNSDCDSNFGFAWTKDSKGPTRKEPLVLYTTQSGAPAGAGTYMRGKKVLYDKGWAMSRGTPLANKITKNLEKWNWKMGTHYFVVNVAFRSGNVCSGSNYQKVGDTVIVNKGGSKSKTIPVTESGSNSAGWLRGSCFDSMGWHRFLNLAGKQSFPWNGADFFPVVAMYDDNNKINAVFFVAAEGQIDAPMIRTNHWEPKDLAHDEMCANLCSPGCGFKNTYNDKWSTMHIYFNDVDTIKCNADSYSPPMKCQKVMGNEWACCEQGALELSSAETPVDVAEQVGQHKALAGMVVALLVGVAVSFTVMFSNRQATAQQATELSPPLETHS